MAALLLIASLLCCCGKKEEPLFEAEAIEFELPPEHGYDTGIRELAETSGITVMFGDHSYSFSGIDAGDRSKVPAPGYYYLTLYSMSHWTYAGRYGMTGYKNFFVPDGENAARIGDVLNRDYTGHTGTVFELLGSEYGIQIEQTLADGSLKCWFAHPDGYVFTPADPAEYQDDVLEFLSMIALPSGLDYARIDPEEFALLAAIEVSYFGEMDWKLSHDFMVSQGILPSDYHKYCMCISSETAHIDLSLPQAKEFLNRYLKWDGKEFDLLPGLADPKERSDFRDLIKITEYYDYALAPEQIFEVVTNYYLSPSGRLMGFSAGEMAYSAGDSIVVSALRAYASEPFFDYNAVKALLETVADEQQTP